METPQGMSDTAACEASERGGRDAIHAFVSGWHRRIGGREQ